MEGSTTTRFRRKIFIVDRKMQSDFVIRSVIVMLIFSAFIIGTMFWSIKRYTTLPIGDDVREAVKYATMSTGIVFVFVLASVTIFFIYLSHKIAGPAFRIKKVMLAMLRGDYSDRANLRKGDYLRDVAKWINKVCEDLQARRERLESAARQAEVLRDLVDGGEGSSEKARELVRATTDALQAALTIEPPPPEPPQS